jgi:hypothetical protein
VNDGVLIEVVHSGHDAISGAVGGISLGEVRRALFSGCHDDRRKPVDSQNCRDAAAAREPREARREPNI